jgi:hypothetical protein
MHCSTMKGSRFIKIGVATLYVSLLCLAAVTACQKQKYPFGRRPGGISLPGVYGSLLAYAGEHDGWFPRSDKGPYAALRQLYPSYCPSGKELAGVSGNIDAVTDALRSGKPLNASLTSWVYVEGLRLDDPVDIAILWECKAGLYYDGRRNDFGGHAVLLVGGDITNVPSADWTSYLARQEKMRKTVQAERVGQANAPAINVSGAELTNAVPHKW